MSTTSPRKTTDDVRSKVRRAPSSRAMAFIALTVILVLGVIALPDLGLAQNTRSGNKVSIGKTDNVNGDLYVAAGTFDLDGQVSGDANIASGRSTIGGTVHGSVNMISGSATISGTVSGSVHIASGEVKVTGRIGGDLVIAGGRVELASNGTVDGNVYLAGGQVELNGTVKGKVTGSTGSLSVGGTTVGAISVNTGDLSITDSARITGQVTYTSRNNASVSSQAQVARGITHKNADPWGSGSHVLGRASGSLLRILWALVAGALLVAIVPRAANSLGAAGRNIGGSLLTGLIALVAIPIIVFVLMITFVGIPAAALIFIAYLAALYLTQVVVGLTIGRFLLPGSWNDGSRGFHLLAMALGVIVLGATRFIPVPYVHAGITLLVTIWGLGAAVSLIDPLFGRQAERTSVARA